MQLLYWYCISYIIRQKAVMNHKLNCYYYYWFLMGAVFPKHYILRVSNSPFVCWIKELWRSKSLTIDVCSMTFTQKKHSKVFLNPDFETEDPVWSSDLIWNLICKACNFICELSFLTTDLTLFIYCHLSKVFHLAICWHSPKILFCNLTIDIMLFFKDTTSTNCEVSKVCYFSR